MSKDAMALLWTGNVEMDGDKDGLPPYDAVTASSRRGNLIFRARRRIPRSRCLRVVGLLLLAILTCSAWTRTHQWPHDAIVSPHGLSMAKLKNDLATCSKLHSKPVDPIGLGRVRNTRYVAGHPPTMIRNATVWIGEPAEGTTDDEARAGKGWGWVSADILLEHGLIKRVGKDIAQFEIPSDTQIYEAKGRQLTSGIIDMHSHAGADSLPALRGNRDENEMSSDITPYARSKDAIQPGDHQIQVIKSGGVTTSLILPGSGNNIGGEAFVIKHAVGRQDGRNETSIEDMLADPDKNWRYMKMACGENAKRVYGKVGERGPVSRMGESWEFRHAFERAASYNQQQDDWCSSADAVGLTNMDSYLPQDLQWEALGAVLRGQVHVNTHCYTIPDLEAMVDHTNEFHFPVRAFHHAHQTFLVPEILRRTWGGIAPASALFATNMYYKAEAYIGSEYASKFLFDQGMTTVFVSDNPVLNAQHVVFEAAKGYKFGLPYHAALAAVTSEPARLLGLGNRLGKIKPGFDADVVVWDSDPLSVGSAPVQIWVDGTAQYDHPFELDKPMTGPIKPDPRLNATTETASQLEDVIISGVRSVYLRRSSITDDVGINAVIRKGRISCLGSCAREIRIATADKVTTIDLHDGYITEPYTAFGSTLGLNAIDAESATDDGDSSKPFARALDGLALDTKKLKAAYDYGITRAITAPIFGKAGTISRHGVSVGFLTKAKTSADKGAVWRDDVAVHYTLDLAAKQGDTPSLSSAIGALRRKLLLAASSKEEDVDLYSEQAYLRKVVVGNVPLVITVHSADVIAAILRVKSVVEKASGKRLRVVLFGGAESYLLADQLAREKVGVILAPLQSYAETWDQRRSLTGAPLTNGTTFDHLIDAGVVTALGLKEDWMVRDLALIAGTAYSNSEGRLSQRDAIDLISRNIYDMLDLKTPDDGGFVVCEGNPLKIGSRVKAVGDGQGSISVF